MLNGEIQWGKVYNELFGKKKKQALSETLFEDLVAFYMWQK